MARRLDSYVRPTGEHHRVTTLELFFDLVFVFAFTQVSALMAHDLTARGLFRGLLLFALLWFAWCSYAWLGNQAVADEGVLRVAMVGAMAAMFAAALAIPEAWEDSAAGLSAPLVLAVALAVVRLGHLGVYLVAASGDAGLRRQLLATLVPVGIAATLFTAGALVDGSARSALWVGAVLVDYGGIYAGGTQGWRLRSPSHFSERHGLVVIIALGESLLAVGTGIAGAPLTGAVLGAALLGLVVTVALWWAYFDLVALMAEGVLSRADGTERARLARDSYTYLHLPIVAGILVLALGLEEVLAHVSDTEAHDLADPLTGVPLGALFGGVSLYLLGHVAFRLRDTGTLNVERTAVAVLLLALVPVAAQLPALASLAVLVALLVALLAYEVVRSWPLRGDVRHAEGDHRPERLRETA